MSKGNPVIEIQDLVRRYRTTDAVHGLDLQVQPGRCYGFFGRNGAGKTTTIKCLLDLLRPSSGRVRVFGEDPARDNPAVKRRFAYVPDNVSYYPWMSVRQWFSYLASFRDKWNDQLERELVARFEIDLNQKANSLSKGQKMQVALIGALCPEPELLILDEPTSGLDPLVRREFIQTVIGAYQEGDPEKRTVFVSTHLITEFEGLIDEFTVIDRGRNIATLMTDEARARFQKLRVRFADTTPERSRLPGLKPSIEGREAEVCVNGNREETIAELRRLGGDVVAEENLSLEEIFLVILDQEKRRA